MKLKIEFGRWGFDIQSESERVRLLVSRDDMEIRVGPYAVNAQSSRTALNGLSVSTPAGERHWYWDEVWAWLAGRSLPPLKGA